MLKMKKRLLALIVALMMTLSFGVTAFAAAPITGDIVVRNTTAGTALELYQILDYKYDPITPAFGTAIINYLNSWNSTLALTTWGQPVLDALDTFAATATAAAHQAFATALNGAIASSATPDYWWTTATDKSANASYASGAITFDDVANGYYLIVDATEYGTETQVSARLYMLSVAFPGATVYLKTTYTTLDKTIPDGFENGGVSIGDEVPFTITAKVPASDAAAFTYTITDVMNDGFAYKMNAGVMIDPVVTVNGVAYALNATTYAFNAATRTMTFNFPSTLVATGDAIVITYTGVVVETTTANGYVNTVTDSTGGQKIVEVFTYGFEVLKIDELNNPLAGIVFAVTDVNGNYLQFNANNVFTGNKMTAAEWAVANDAAKAGYLRTTNATGNIIVKGLAGGEYFLEEIATLAGFNLLDAPVRLRIVPTLVGGEASKDWTVQVWVAGVGDAGSWADVTNHVITVVNNHGIDLPETGGIGTALFTIIGSMMILCAGAVLMLGKKRALSK